MAHALLSCRGVAGLPSTEELRAIVEIAHGIGREAADLLRAAFRSGGVVREKGRSDLVTEHDEACERLLRDRLGRAFPSHGIVGEEGEAERRDRDLCWYVDPIDGTSNFAHGHPFFCVAMGLAHLERPLAGVVIAPAMGLEWIGGRGLGVQRNGARASVSRTTALSAALCATGFPANRASSADNNYPAFLAVDAASHGVRRCGAAAMEICMVADGAYDAFWDLGLKPWDVCAGAALVEEAGGRVSDFAGEPYRLGGGRILATNALIHDEAAAALAHRLPLPPLTLPGSSGLRTGSGVG